MASLKRSIFSKSTKVKIIRFKSHPSALMLKGKVPNYQERTTSYLRPLPTSSHMDRRDFSCLLPRKKLHHHLICFLPYHGVLLYS